MDGMKILENLAFGAQKHPYYAVIRYTHDGERDVVYFDELEDAQDCYYESKETHPQGWLNLVPVGKPEVTLEHYGSLR